MTLIIKKPTGGKLVMAKGQPVTIDPSYSFTSLLLHGDTDPIIDSGSGRYSLSTTGAATSTSQAKYGGRSIFFNGSSGVSQWVDAPISAAPVGTDNFTIEAWIYLGLASGRDFVIFDSRLPSAVLDGNSARNGFVLFINSTSKLQVFDGGAYSLRAASVSTSVAENAWQHIAFVKSGSTHTYYINGTAYGSFTASDTSGPSGCRVGARNDQRFGFNGYIDDLRITKGVARYTANFTPPTSPFPDF